MQNLTKTTGGFINARMTKTGIAYQAHCLHCGDNIALWSNTVITQCCDKCHDKQWHKETPDTLRYSNGVKFFFRTSKGLEHCSALGTPLGIFAPKDDNIAETVALLNGYQFFFIGQNCYKCEAI